MDGREDGERRSKKRLEIPTCRQEKGLPGIGVSRLGERTRRLQRGRMGEERELSASANLVIAGAWAGGGGSSPGGAGKGKGRTDPGKYRKLPQLG